METGIVETLLQNHRAFRNFLVSRVDSEVDAEDLLQQSLVKALRQSQPLRNPDSLVSWFYQILRNALTDHYRSKAAETRKKTALERESLPDAPPLEEIEAALCGCLAGLLPSLKPQYAEMIRRSDLESESLAAIAEDLGITENNASVRLHRARHALKTRLIRACGACTEHSCLDCTCQPALAKKTGMEV